MTYFYIFLSYLFCWKQQQNTLLLSCFFFAQVTQHKQTMKNALVNENILLGICKRKQKKQLTQKKQQQKVATVVLVFRVLQRSSTHHYHHNHQKCRKGIFETMTIKAFKQKKKKKLLAKCTKFCFYFLALLLFFLNFLRRGKRKEGLYESVQVVVISGKYRE